MRLRGEVAKERTDAVHLMTQAEFDVKEMQESMQNNKRTQVSGVHLVTACRFSSCARLALVVGAADCVPWLLTSTMCSSRAASFCLTLTGQNVDRLLRCMAQANSWHPCVVPFCTCCAW